MTFDEWWQMTKPAEVDDLKDYFEEAYIAGTNASRACARDILKLTRSDVSLMAGEMSAQEWRTVDAVLRALRARIMGGTE